MQEQKAPEKVQIVEGGTEKVEEGPTPEIFAQIDIRIGVIKQCWKHPESDKLYCQKVEVFGEEREIASGLQQFVTPDQMTGKIVVMANLKPRKLAGFLSNGMVVCASNADHTKVQLLIPQGQQDERLKLEGFEQIFKDQAQPVLNPKKKIVEKCAPFFQTDEQGFVTWKGIKLKTSVGYIKSTLPNGSVS